MAKLIIPDVKEPRINEVMTKDVGIRTSNAVPNAYYEITLDEINQLVSINSLTVKDLYSGEVLGIFDHTQPSTSIVIKTLSKGFCISVDYDSTNEDVMLYRLFSCKLKGE